MLGLYRIINNIKPTQIAERNTLSSSINILHISRFIEPQNQKLIYMHYKNGHFEHVPLQIGNIDLIIIPERDIHCIGLLDEYYLLFILRPFPSLLFSWK